jgi:hypothetical protein
MERGCVMKLARVTHIFAHRKSGEEQGFELGFCSLPTDNALVTTTTFTYKNSSGRELAHNTIKETKRGAA